MDQINVRGWTGRNATQQGVIDTAMAQRLQATLGKPGQPALSCGVRLPELWHWTGFTPTAALADLGEDGHPRPGDFLPPMQGMRRMWAGGALRFHRPLHVGEPLTRQSVIRDIREKDSPAGKRIFVTVQHHISGGVGLAIEERQDIVYLPPATGYTPPKPRPMPACPDQSDRMTASEVLLFRYSALTFNSHRIHYDLTYAQQAEHYPALVVHGPLQATRLMDLATRHRGRPPTEFDYRGVHPVFAGQVDLAAVEEDGALMLCTGQDGHMGMQAHAIWEDTV